MIFKLFAYPRVSVPDNVSGREQVRISQIARGYMPNGPLRDVEAEDFDSATELFLDQHSHDGVALGCSSGAWSVQQL